MWESLHRELIYLWYYTDIQVRQIFWYWVLGVVVGSVVSVFVKARLHALCATVGARLSGVAGWVLGSLLGIASPLCMYGTIPICASFSQKGIKEDFLAAFMMSSMLLNPQLIMYSFALGEKVL
ncbi:MAG: permease, partial [Victivallales bacterium]|nr:permease [Victivallales bacterium]